MGKNETIYHKHYTVCWDHDAWCCNYSGNPIRSIQLRWSETDVDEVTVNYRTGETYTWKCNYISSYIGQFGVSVSPDGERIFVQTWETGLFCFCARTGERIWRTKSRRGVTDIFVGDTTLTVQRHDYGMELISMETGEVIRELRPYGAWGFTAVNHRYLISGVRKWDLIEAETLEIKERFSNKEFTGGHADYTVNHISTDEAGRICVRGFRNVWDETVKPPKMLPNLEFEHFVDSMILRTEGELMI